MHNTLLKDYSGHGVALGLMAFLVVSAIAVGVGYIRWWSLFCYVWLTYSVAYTSLWLLKRHSQREPSLGVAIVVALVSIGLGAASAFYLTSAASNLTWAGSYIEAM
ncbi:MAG: hypothetical protein JNM52_05860, partial [Betaproteobacteria bacterium]|nr:hypothetical protein [Betaproteobacteria bacterium]